MAFVQRIIGVSFTLAQGNFQGQNSNVVNVGGLAGANQPLWMSAKIHNPGAPAGSTLNLAIYGLTQNLMNQLATLGMAITQVPRNTITVQAGDATTGLTTVFIGTVKEAYSDFQNAPEVVFRVEAQSGLAFQVLPASPLSFKGSTDVATMLSQLAQAMGLTFENNGVNIKLSSPYYPGTARDQAYSIAHAAGIGIDDSNGILSIWPGGGVRQNGGTVIPIISPSTGMVGYPAFNNQGMIVKTLFNPAVTFQSSVQLQSSLLENLKSTSNNQFAQQRLNVPNSTWGIYQLDHDLETLPHGQWFSMLYCFNPNYQQPVSSGR